MILTKLFILLAVLLTVCIGLIIIAALTNDITLFQATVVGYMIVAVLLTIKFIKL